MLRGNALAKAGNPLLAVFPFIVMITTGIWHKLDCTTEGKKLVIFIIQCKGRIYGTFETG
jgi:hypothetical protein